MINYIRFTSCFLMNVIRPGDRNEVKSENNHSILEEVMIGFDRF